MEVKQNKGENRNRPCRRDKTKTNKFFKKGARTSRQKEKKSSRPRRRDKTKRNKNQKIGSHEPQKTNKACRQGSLIIPRYKDWLFPPIFLFFISHYLHSSVANFGINSNACYIISARAFCEIGRLLGLFKIKQYPTRSNKIPNQDEYCHFIHQLMLSQYGAQLKEMSPKRLRDILHMSAHR